MAEFSMVWRGDKVRDDILDSCVEAMQELAVVGEANVREGAPVRTGFLRDSVYSFVDVTGGRGSRTPSLLLGASAEYASYVELGTRFVPGRPFILSGALTVLPLIAPTLARIVQNKGYSGSATFGSSGPGDTNPYVGGRLGALLPDALAEGQITAP